MPCTVDGATLGCGHIATKMAAAVKALESRGMGVEAYAVASRTLEKAQKFAADYGFKCAYGSYAELAQDSLENIFCEFEKFVAIWTDKVAIKKIIADFIEWDKRNPFEKRRAGLVDYEKDPVPSKVCFGIPAHVIEYILVHF